MSDLLDNTKFVKLTTATSLALAEAIKNNLRENQIAAVIINDEEFQEKDKAERMKAVAKGDPFRIEVPEDMLGKAKGVLNSFLDNLGKRRS